MTSLPVCACGCGRHAPAEHAMQDSGGAWWRMTCVQRTLKGVRSLQNLPPDALGTLVSILRAHGFGLADAVVGSLPFEARDA